MTDAFSITAGARYFENESTLEGVVGWGPNLYGLNDTPVDADYKDDDTIFKLNATWRINDDFMIYATLSEGYRPGGLNRDPGLISIGEFEYQPDILTNLEFGWKSDLADGRVRWNGAIYRADWEDIQYTIYQFSLSPCCGSVYNLADAVILGLETDITAMLTDNWTLSAAMALNNGETDGDFILPSGLLAVPDGTELPNVPDIKANVSTRYDFQMGGMDAYWQIVYSYTGESYNEIRPGSRVKQDSYGILNLRAGIDKESWGVDLFVNNATDEVAQIYVSPRPYEPSTTTNRPMTYGAKLWTRF